LRPDELQDRAGVTVPDDGPWETVGGYLMAELGRLPRVADVVEIPEGTFRIERLDGRRIDRVRFTPRPLGAPEAGEAR
jgi:CBS domain containing-hemolysin-like protein